MNCPIDNAQLAITERQGVEIDYCPQCRGVWLDRGELDKIIEKSEAAYPSAPAAPRHDGRPPKQEYARDYDDNHRHDDHHYKKKKRESFIGDLFDF